MHRRPLLDLLERYTHRFPEEQKMLHRILQLIESSPDCFERTCRPGHITGSAWVMNEDQSQCLLVHHRKLDRWLQPGGHADGENNIEQVALREVEEETGLSNLKLAMHHEQLVPLDVDVHIIPERKDASGNLIEDAHEHHDIRFLILAGQEQELVLSEESHDLRWFSHSEVLDTTREESVLRMMRKAGPFADCRT